MQVQIKATKIDLTEELKNYVQEKMDMLEKYLGQVKATNCDVEVGIFVGAQNSGEIYRCEVNLQVPGELLRVEKSAKELYKAIDKTKDHMKRSIKKYKEKRIDKKRQGLDPS